MRIRFPTGAGSNSYSISKYKINVGEKLCVETGDLSIGASTWAYFKCTLPVTGDYVKIS